MSELRFFWNGIKGSSKKLQKCMYWNNNDGSITIHATDYKHFDSDVRKHFEVKNESDVMTDYFEQDSIRVLPDHPLFAEVMAAVEARKEHFEKIRENRNIRYRKLVGTYY